MKLSVSLLFMGEKSSDSRSYGRDTDVFYKDGSSKFEGVITEVESKKQTSRSRTTPI